MEAREYLSVLNPEQLAAVEHIGSPLLILAGAGSGKTRVITTKIAYMIAELGLQPSSILAVTFTKKAAKEMQERAERLDSRASKSYIRTFHSFGAWFLRLNAEEAGVAQNFTVYDDDDMVTLVGKAVKNISKQEATHIAHKISLAKDYGLTPNDDLSVIEQDPLFPEYYASYEKRLRQTGNVDFGDLILLPVLLMKENPSVRSYMHHKFRVIMVDEYQDSNVAQFQLLEQLVGEGTYVCVVGDDDQSIYKFRGAEVRNILDFQNHFEGTEVIKLEKNYRSYAPILSVADSVVSNNSNRLGKTLHAQRGEGPKPKLVFLPNQDDETSFCASLIKEAAKQGVPYSDWAILYRTNAQSLGFETEFLHKNIPYTVVGTLKFYEREEIKDVLAYLSFIVNPKDEIAFRRIVNKPVRTVGNVTQDKVVDLYRENASLNSKLNSEKSYTLIDACLELLPKLPKRGKEGLNTFVEIIQELKTIIDEAPVSDESEFAAEKLAMDIAMGRTQEDVQKKSQKNCDKLSVFVDKLIEKSGLKIYHESQDEISGTQRVGNMQELVNSAVLYEKNLWGLLDFLDHIELDRTLESAQGENEADAVTLITIHNTKGLEFPRVFVTGMEYGIFPRRDKVDEEIEEERRLFYVAITRAKDELYLTSCGIRRIYGRTDFMEISPFLLEINSEDIDIVGKIPPSYKRVKKTSLNFGKQINGITSKTNYGEEVDEVAEKWCKGARIYHDEQGYGMIIRTNTSETEHVITVQFENGAIRRYMPKYHGNRLMIAKD